MERLAWWRVKVQNNIIHLCFRLSSGCPRGGGGSGGERKECEGVRGNRRHAKQGNLSFWEMCEVTACRNKTTTTLQITGNQMSSSNAGSGSQEIQFQIISGSKTESCFCYLLHPVKHNEYHSPTTPLKERASRILPSASLNICQAPNLETVALSNRPK